MPEFITIRKDITPAVRTIPTDRTLAVLPMTLDRVGKEVENEKEAAKLVKSIDDAIKEFSRPVRFEARVGEEATEFVVELEIQKLKDFEPKNVQKRVAGKQNDLADLGSRIDLLYRLKDCWSIPAVKRAWQNPEHRKQIIAILNDLSGKIEQLTKREEN